ncbi:MAG: WXG100 family type VII secretion target [Anaerolineales bacterium]|nr:WXG100 family type VII secretion target [Anaerolineales bacterium]
MARILVTPEEVHQVANQFNQASQESEQMVQRLESTVNNLAPNWDGMTSQRFYSDYETWRTSMRQFVEMLGQVSQEMHAIADRFAAADQQ